MNRARLPILSTRRPKSGVAIRAAMGRALLYWPATWRVSSHDSMKNLMAKDRKGKIAE